MRAILFDRRGVGRDHIAHAADVPDHTPEVIIWQARAFVRDGCGEHAGRMAALYVECDVVVLEERPGGSALPQPSEAAA